MGNLIYTTNGPVDDGFRIKRSEEDGIRELIVNDGPYVPLCCGRQMGKTTLMYQIRDRLQADDFGTAYLYLGNMSDLSSARFYEVICDELFKQLANCCESNIARPNARIVTDQPAFVDFMEWIATKTGRCNKIVIMLDEVGGVPREFASSFWGGLRSIFTRRGVFRRLRFVLAGELDLSYLATSNNSPLINVCVTPFVELSDFTNNNVAELVEAGLPGCDSISDSVYGWTSGHPYLTQKLCTLIATDKTAHPEDWSDASIKDRIDKLVTMYFQNREDSNLLHLENCLNQKPNYRKRIQRIMTDGSVGSTPMYRELAILGVVKLGTDHQYRIRNRLYELAMRNYLEDYQEV